MKNNFLSRRLITAVMMLILFLASKVSTAQSDFKKLKEFPVSGVSRISMDRLGDFYLTIEGGKIKKYDPEGNFMLEFGNPEKDTTTLLEPWNPLLLFRYIKGKQQIELYDRYFELQQKISIDPAWAIQPVLACPGITNTFWLLDKADASLKLVDPKTKGVVRETVIKLPAGVAPEFVYMREYQSLLFLVDKNSGVFIFNTVGTLVYRINAPAIQNMGVLGEEFYYLSDGKLNFFDLYTADRHEYVIDPSVKLVMVTDERMIIVHDTMVEVREFKE